MSGSPFEMLYTYDIALIEESVDELVGMFRRRDKG